jgi:hypothetical protein
MAVGTAAALLPVKSTTRKSTSDKFVYQNGASEAGPCCMKLSAMLKAIQKGKVEDTYGWCVDVTEVKDDEKRDGLAINGTAKFSLIPQKKSKRTVLDAVPGLAFGALALTIAGLAMCIKF